MEAKTNQKTIVLVVDDSAMNLASVEQKLRDRYEVITVNSGDRALRYLKNEKPDLILLDIKMDKMDGIETLKEMRKMDNGADIPVIMLTAKNDKDSVVETTRFGIYDYVLKPFDGDDLHQRIQRALAKAKENEKNKN